MSDVILNYRTIISFGGKNIDKIMEKYEKLLEEPVNRRVRNAHIAGVAFGYSCCVRLLYMGGVFFAGALLVSKYDLNAKSVFQAIFIMFATSLGAGGAISQVPSATQARESAERVFAIVDEPSTLDVREDKKTSIKTVKNGQIEFKDVTFNYPSRKQKVLKKFDMVIPSGKKIGLVGHSGCGKSTITNLLLRFYEL